ncbi:MAG: hypothetical protein M1834_007585 [Cirrosporium novae-zelandiae]|nr:MAG: hypothetical protein M1834_007585 [Cirrosporium novae-zelandiae]
MSNLNNNKAKIALIICSQRSPRIGPKVADFVLNVLAEHHQSSPRDYDLVQIDLKNWKLPIFDEPTIPAHVYDAASYVQPHTKAWSAEISKHAGFIFVCPQYNWGYPASVKNAIDYLYHEWEGKAAMIVSYGGRGGGKAAEQLRQVLLGVRMKVTGTMPGLSLKAEGSMKAAMEEGELVSQARDMWKSEQDLILKAFVELHELL